MEASAMRCSSFALAAIVLAASAGVLAQGPTYRMGTTPSAEEIQGRFPVAFPQGAGLPAGRGGVKDGAGVYAKKCASCHGANGTGTPLHRGLIPLGNNKPLEVTGGLVPYATTVFDFIYRAMPWFQPGTMPPDEAYAVTAYVLFLNGVIKENDVLDQATLPKVQMPNATNFVGVELDWKTGQRRPLGYYPKP
jgi:S-disulfanyl-L-cysteine oxidoreductase SoxD